MHSVQTTAATSVCLCESGVSALKEGSGGSSWNRNKNREKAQSLSKIQNQPGSRTLEGESVMRTGTKDSGRLSDQRRKQTRYETTTKQEF